MRGIVFIIEAVIAGLLLLSFIALIPSLMFKQPTLENPGWQLLQGLDSQGRLRNWTVAEDPIGLNAQIDIPYWNHSVQICNQTACVGSVPNATQLLTSVRFVAGEHNYSPHIVRLFLWK